ncbi:hypothetical protein WMF04_30700 [Sorangium sp. So ce260]|uniref:hypothetical protein n=1 Tax=Sorangium sp. So ce260 TaxID=3133291 RepID=UPI003F640BF1
MVPSRHEISAPRPAQANGRARAAPPEAASEPPPAPAMRRRLELSPKHAIGALVLACVAASAAFMHARETGEATAPGLALRVAYPERMRFRDTEKLTFDVTRTADAPCRSAALAVDEAYLDSFEERHATPTETTIGRFELGGLAPGEQRRIVLELRGERPWRASGNATLSCDGERGAEVPLRTFIFP